MTRRANGNPLLIDRQNAFRRAAGKGAVCCLRGDPCKKRPMAMFGDMSGPIPPRAFQACPPLGNKKGHPAFELMNARCPEDYFTPPMPFPVLFASCLPGLRSVAGVRAGSRGRVPARSGSDVRHAVHVRRSGHCGRAVAGAVARAACRARRVVERVLAGRRRYGVTGAAYRGRRHRGACLRQDGRSSGAARGRCGQLRPGLGIVGLASSPGRVRERGAGRDRRNIITGLRQDRRSSGAARGRCGQLRSGLGIVGPASSPGRVRERGAGRDRRNIITGLRQEGYPHAAGGR
jgi:hypothetical protein